MRLRAPSGLLCSIFARAGTRVLARCAATCAIVLVGLVDHVRAQPLQVVPLPGVTSSHAPAIEDFASRLRIVVTAQDGDADPADPIYVSSTGPGGAGLAAWTAIPGLTSLSGPAIKAFRGKLYVAARGPDDRLYLASSVDGTRWSGWTDVPGNVVTDAPALKPFQNRLYAATRSDGGVISISASSDGSNWGPWLTPAIGRTPYAPALTQFGGRLTLVYTVPLRPGDSDGLIFMSSSSNGTAWTTPEQLPGWGLGGEDNELILTTETAPSATVLDGELFVSARVGDFDIEDSLRLIARESGSSAWSGWEETGRAVGSSVSLTTFGGHLYAACLAWDASDLILLFR